MSIMSIYRNPVLLRILPGDDYLYLSTIDHTHRRSRTFYANRSNLLHWLNNGMRGIFHDNDLLNSLYAYSNDNGSVTLNLMWLRECGSHGDLTGYRQVVYVPVSRLREAVTGTAVSVLIDTEAHHKSRIELTDNAQRKIAGFMKDKRIKRALFKALRDNFFYPGSTVTLCADFGQDFFFRTDSFCGGLCCSRTTVIGKDGRKYERISFSVHT